MAKFTKFGIYEIELQEFIAKVSANLPRDVLIDWFHDQAVFINQGAQHVFYTAKIESVKKETGRYPTVTPQHMLDQRTAGFKALLPALLKQFPSNDQTATERVTAAFNDFMDTAIVKHEFFSALQAEITNAMNQEIERREQNREPELSREEKAKFAINEFEKAKNSHPELLAEIEDTILITNEFIKIMQEIAKEQQAKANQPFHQLAYDANKQRFEQEKLGIEIFKDHPTFNHPSYIRAFSYLLKYNNLSITEALNKLDTLEADQAKAISNGMAEDDIKGLSPAQLSAMFKHNLPRKDVEGLSDFQFKVFFKLRHLGVTLGLVPDNKWLAEDEQISLLGNLLSVKKLTLESALNIVSEIQNDHQTAAISYGMSWDKVSTASKEELNEFLKFKYDEMKKELESAHLTESEFVNITWMSIAELAKYPWLQSQEQADALSYLLRERFLPFEQAVQEMEGLNDEQLKLGIRKGLTKQEMLSLANPAQMEALVKCRGIVRGLNVGHFAGTESWFNSHEHAIALYDLFYCLNRGEHFTIAEAFQELQGLTREQANRISHGVSRKEILAAANATATIAAPAPTTALNPNPEVLNATQSRGYHFNSFFRYLLSCVKKPEVDDSPRPSRSLTGRQT